MTQEMYLTERLAVGLRPSELKAFKAAADLVGLTASAWARMHLRMSAEDELRAAGQRVPFLNGGRP